MSIAVESENVSFERETHSYTLEDGQRVMSVTQILQFAGLVNYGGIPPAILAYAAWRGSLVHEATAYLDKGIDIYTQFDLPDEIMPYVHAWEAFKLEFDFIPDLEEIERPRVVTVSGIQYAMTPDVPGTMRGIPTVVEKKATVAMHPCWGIQLAAYEAGLKRPKGYRNWQRIAVQLLPTAKFKLHIFDKASDFAMFQHSHSVAAWKLNNRLIKLAA